MNVFAVTPAPFQTWGGWLILGMLLLNFAAMVAVVVMLWRFRLDGTAFLSGARSLLDVSKDERNIAVTVAKMLRGLVDDMKAAAVSAAAKLEKAAAGRDSLAKDTNEAVKVIAHQTNSMLADRDAANVAKGGAAEVVRRDAEDHDKRGVQ